MPDYYLRKRFSNSKISIILRTLPFFKKNCYMTHMNTKRRYFYESPKITVVEIRIKSRILILSDPSGNRPGPIKATIRFGQPRPWA
jgi:hypothetical protein